MGSAFLTEILTCGGDFSIDIGLQAKRIIQQSNMLKTHIKTTIEDEKVNLEELLNNNMQLLTEARYSLEKMLKLQEEINSEIKPELSSCKEELDELSFFLLEVNMNLTFLVKLSEIHSLINKAEKKLADKEFYECAKLIKEYQKLMEKDEDDLKCIELYKSLSSEGFKCYEKILQDIRTAWSTYVQLDIEALKEIRLSKFHINVDCISEITDILKASDCLEYTSFEDDFVENFLTCIGNEIIMNKVIVKELTYKNKDLTVEILHGTVKKSTFPEVISNLKKVLNFLTNYLDVDLREDLKFIKKIGKNIGTELTECLVTDYMVKMIPNTTSELEKYDELMILAEDFDTYLKENGFLPQNSTIILDHKNNMYDVFVNRFCTTNLDKARIIMMKELNKTLHSEDILITELDKLPENCANILKNKFHIKQPCYVYPKTQISKTAQEITDLVKEIMLEAMRSKDSYALPVLNTILNIFEMYTAIVPLHHKKSLETMPLQAAVFHNNCLYFTYYLINLASEYYGRVSPVLRDHFHKFLEGAVWMRSLAKEKFEEHVTSQKSNIVYIMQNTGIDIFDDTIKPNSKCDGCIQQCMKELQILESTWKELLPLKVYNRAMGFLLDIFIDEVISVIMKVEDIASKMATHLVSMLNIILKKAPSLFLDPKEIFKHSTKWLKLNEFVLVLKGNLKDVDHRWSDGMGPLALEFTPEQVKHLVRALFQNSDRRSELLSRIK